MNNDSQQPEQEGLTVIQREGIMTCYICNVPITPEQQQDYQWKVAHIESHKQPQPATTLTNEEIAKRATEPHTTPELMAEKARIDQLEPTPRIVNITAVEEPNVAQDVAQQSVCQACKPAPGKTINVTHENKCVVCGKDVMTTPASQIQEQAPSRNEKGQFVPGVSGNPKGRVKRDWTWKEVLEDIAQMYVKKKDGTISKKTYKEMVGQRLYSLSIGGNVQAITLLMNRMDGMPKQDIEGSGNFTLVMHDSLKQDDE